MQQLIEFECFWSANYNQEQVESYTIMYGDDREKWPPIKESSRISIDVNNITAMNPADNDEHTIVRLGDGRGYEIMIEYDTLKAFLQSLGISIITYYALQNNHK